MNNRSLYFHQLEESTLEDSEGLQKFLEQHRNKAYSSYPKEEEIKYCFICGEPLVYKSLAYFEGFHFDSCL